MSELSIDAIFERGGIERQLIQDVIRSDFPPFSTDVLCVIDGKPTRINDLGKRLRDVDTDNFEVTNSEENWFISGCGMSGYQMSLLSIDSRVIDVCRAKCLSRIIASYPTFRMLRVYDSEYHRTQNETCIDALERSGVDMSTIRVCWNDYPPPLRQKIVDVSDNPGRRILQEGYVEAIAPFMIFSRDLCQELGVDESSVSSLSNIEATPKLLVIDSGHRFDSTPQSVRLQRQLRKCPFPQS